MSAEHSCCSGVIPLLPTPISTAWGFAANLSGSSISVVATGTPIPLPSSQNFSPDITSNTANTVFTLATSGVYFIFYNINLSAARNVGIRLIINGVPFPASIIDGSNRSAFSASIIVTLPPTSTLTLQFFGNVTAPLLSNSVGASLTIIHVG